MSEIRLNRWSNRGAPAAVFLLLVTVTATVFGQGGGGVLVTPTSPYSPPYAAITYPAADPTSQSTTVFTPCPAKMFALVGLQPGQAVNVVVQYPTSQALQIVNLTAPDGGVILPPSADTPTIVTPVFPPCADGQCPPATVGSRSLSLVIAADGTLSFTFVATNEPGRYQVPLRIAGATQALVLQFYALDPQNPQQNPGCITASTPDY